MKENKFVHVALAASIALGGLLGTAPQFTTNKAEAAASFDPRPTAADLKKGFYNYFGRQAIKQYKGIPMTYSAGLKEFGTGKLKLLGIIDKKGSMSFLTDVNPANGVPTQYVTPVFKNVTKERFVTMMKELSQTTAKKTSVEIGFNKYKNEAARFSVVPGNFVPIIILADDKPHLLDVERFGKGKLPFTFFARDRALDRTRNVTMSKTHLKINLKALGYKEADAIRIANYIVQDLEKDALLKSDEAIIEKKMDGETIKIINVSVNGIKMQKILINFGKDVGVLSTYLI